MKPVIKKVVKKPATLSKKKLILIQREMTVAHDDYNNGLLRRAMYKTNDNDTSQDLVQTTFLKTLLYLQKGGKIDLMRSFLNHVLNDLIIDEYRSQKKKAISLDTLQGTGFEPATDNIKRDINILDGEKVILLIPQLSEKYELVIRMRYLKGLTLKEMSATTGHSENTVAVQVHRGLKMLKKIYTTNHTS